jgi:ADP-ribose pyrophosphatase YjhB (NUDIX family)
MGEKNSHCSYCGAQFEVESWPRACSQCQQISYINPLPVAVILVPVDDGVLTIRRGAGVGASQLAFPGGYIEVGESWQHGGARELYEETGMRVDPESISDFKVVSAPDGTVLIFGLAKSCTEGELPPFAKNSETTERVIVNELQELAFPLHSQALELFFARKNSQSNPSLPIKE